MRAGSLSKSKRARSYLGSVSGRPCTERNFLRRALIPGGRFRGPARESIRCTRAPRSSLGDPPWNNRRNRRVIVTLHNKRAPISWRFRPSCGRRGGMIDQLLAVGGEGGERLGVCIMPRVGGGDSEAVLQSPVTGGRAIVHVERLAGKAAVAEHVSPAVPGRRQVDLKADFRQDLAGDAAVFGCPLRCRNHSSGDDREFIAGEAAEILAGDFGCAPDFVRRGIPVLELIAVLRQCARGNKVAQENRHRHEDMRENGNDRLVPHEKPPGRKPPAPCRSEGEWTAVVAKPNGRVTRKEPWLRSPLNQELNDFSSFRLCLTLRIEFLKERKFKPGLLGLRQSCIGHS